MSAGGNQNLGGQRPMYQAHSQPNGVSEYPNQSTAPWLSYRPERSVYQPTFVEQPNAYPVYNEHPNAWTTQFPSQPNYQVHEERPNSWTAQIPSQPNCQVYGEHPNLGTTQIPIQPNIPSQNLMQRLEQEFAFARRRNQEYENTSMHLG